MGQLQSFAPLRKFLLSKPAAQGSYPFGPGALVFKVGEKMFAVVAEDGDPLTMTLKCDPDEALALRNEYPRSILPGYHTDKRHWNTIVLDGELNDALIKEMIGQSYELVVAKLPKAVKEKLGRR
jgi:predicted DNA-binding protein (MmcQ/YjbR family)